MRNRGRTAFIVSFLAPAVFLYGLFVIWPVLQAIGFSFFRWSGISSKKTYVGFENFKSLFHDSIFWQSLVHNAWIFVFGGAGILIIALGVAHAMQGETRLNKALRSVYLFPNIMSLVVVAILWQFAYHPRIGLLTSALKFLGFNHASKAGGPIVEQSILGNGDKALPAIIVTFIWYAVGFYIMLLSAGIRQIPQEVTEASKLDGAEGFFRFRRITLPLLWSVGRISVIYLVINTLNVFALVYLMTQGGPDRKTEVMLTYLYEQAFVNSDYGLATALAIANFIIIMAVSGVVMGLTRKDPSGVQN